MRLRSPKGDPRALTDFYRDCARRAVRGGRNRAAIARKHIEVNWLPEYGQQLEVNICEGLGRAVIELGWCPVAGAWPIEYGPADAHLAQYSRPVITAWLRHPLTQYRLIDAHGKGRRIGETGTHRRVSGDSRRAAACR